MNDPKIEIVNYSSEFRAAFEALNRTWIEGNFKMEETDLAYLTQPERNVIDPGGAILFLLENGEPVGTCALIKQGEKEYELAKMAVDPSARGNGYGKRLMEAILKEAQDRYATRIYLVTDEKLEPAVALYEKFGFRKVEHDSSQPYQRGNLQMELDLS